MNASELILNFNKWVVIGDILNEKKYASRIFYKFKNSGYTVEGIHPRGGDNIYKNLKEVPFKIEVIDLCINHIEGIKYVVEAKELGIKNILIQPGAESEEILNFCKLNGINVVEGCALVEFGKLML